MTNVSKNQVLLTVPESMMLVLGADADRFVSIETPNKESFNPTSPAFRKTYEDILNSILLSGSATVCAPSYLKNDAAFEKLAAEDILQIVEHDYSQSLRAQLSNHYEKAFIEYRELETHPNYSSKKYLHDLQSPDGWRPYSNVEIQEKIGNLEFHQDRLHKTLVSVTEPLQGLFGHHFAAHRSLYGSLIEEVIEDRVPDGKVYEVQRLIGEGSSNNSLFGIMGLEIRSAELQDMSIPLFSFLPNDLRNFHEKDSSLFGSGGDFSSYVKLGMEFALRLNQSDYVLAHAFWKALFEMVDLLHLSERTKCPIYMPLDIPVKDDGQKPDDTIREDLRRIYKIYLSERGFTPKLDCIQDLLRLREDKRLDPLREVLGIWQSELSKEDVDGMNFVKVEIERARIEIQRLERYSRYGRYIGYASLPMGFVDLAVGTPIGLALAPLGVALNVYFKKKLEKFNWLNFGT